LDQEEREIIWYEVIIPNFKILICTVYRPPGSVAAFWENFEYSIGQAMNYTSNIIINGDLNVDLLRENNNKLLEIISEFNLPQNNFYLSLIFDQKTHQLIYHYQLYLYLSGFL
jgi:hypothetical protein